MSSWGDPFAQSSLRHVSDEGDRVTIEIDHGRKFVEECRLDIDIVPALLDEWSPEAYQMRYFGDIAIEAAHQIAQGTLQAGAFLVGFVNLGQAAGFNGGGGWIHG